MTTRSARYVGMLAGGWLFLSGFLWMHTALEWANTLVMGIVVIVVSLAAARTPALRFLNALVGVWLIAAAFYLHAFSTGTRWSNLVTGLLLALVSLVRRPVQRPRLVRSA